MPREVLERTTVIPAPPVEVFRFFSDPRNLLLVAPEKLHCRILSLPPGGILAEGERIDFSIRLWGVPLHWTSRITSWREGEFFEDLQERGPYRYWLHSHSFRIYGGATEMMDRVVYELPFGVAGRLLGRRVVDHELRAIFAHRSEAIRRMFRPRKHEPLVASA